MRKKMLVFGLVALALMYGSSIAQANTITGSLWHVLQPIAANAILANVPGGPADVTFDVDSPFTFDNRASSNDKSVGAFLASGSAFNIVENTAGTLTSLMTTGAAATDVGTLFDFKGFVTVTNGQQFTVTHDDGLTLDIGGILVVNVPLPTAPITTTVTYTGPSGNLPFELVYGECSGPPAVLQVDLPLSNPVPLPSAMLLIGAGLARLGAYSLKRCKV